jgi:cytochrome c biogenesis protein ResB
VYDAPIQLFGADKTQQTGALKVPDFDYTVPGAHIPLQIGARLALFPDARQMAQLGSNGMVDPSLVQFAPGGEEARNPVLELQLFVGDLGLNSGVPQNVNALDTNAMQPYFSDAHVLPLALGQTQTLVLPGSGGKQVPFRITFKALRQYSLFQVSKDSGVLLVYITFGLVMTGLMTKLYLRPLLERRERRHRPAPVQLSPVWTTDSSREPTAVS